LVPFSFVEKKMNSHSKGEKLLLHFSQTLDPCRAAKESQKRSAAIKATRSTPKPLDARLREQDESGRHKKADPKVGFFSSNYKQKTTTKHHSPE